MFGIYGIYAQGRLSRPSGIARSGFISALPLITVLSLLADVAGAQSIAELRAAYYFNALKFAHWNPDPMPDAPLNIVLFGQGEVCAILARELPTRSIAGRKIQVAVLSSLGSNDNDNLPDVLSDADAVYFASSTSKIYGELLQRLSNRVLTTSSIPQFAEHGGMIEIAETESSPALEFHINTEVLKSSAIMVEPQLLSLSKIVGKQLRKQSSAAKAVAGQHQ